MPKLENPFADKLDGSETEGQKQKRLEREKWAGGFMTEFGNRVPALQDVRLQQVQDGDKIRVRLLAGRDANRVILDALRGEMQERVGYTQLFSRDSSSAADNGEYIYNGKLDAEHGPFEAIMLLMSSSKMERFVDHVLQQRREAEKAERERERRRREEKDADLNAARGKLNELI